MQISQNIEAIQWNGGAHDGIVPEPLRLHYSLQRDAFYVTGGKRPAMWLSTQAFDGEPSEEEKEKSKGMFSPGIAFFTHKDGRKWWRRVWSFTCWDIKSGEVVRVDPAVEGAELELVRDFASLNQWESLTDPECAWFDAPDGIPAGRPGQRILFKGDWLLKYANNTTEVVKDEEFKKRFGTV